MRKSKKKRTRIRKRKKKIPKSFRVEHRVMKELTQRWVLKHRFPIEASAGYLGGIGLLVYEILRCLRRRWEGQTILKQMEQVGVRSLSVVILTAVFTGMVLALQMGSYLTRFGARPYGGRILAVSMIREMGPVLTALMIGGRVGAGITAEIGSMKVTEQIDAMRSLGTNPIHKLVFPRVIALVIMLPLLTIVADFVGILGGMVITMLEHDVSASFYLNSIIQFIRFQDLYSGLGKTFFFGFFIAVIACYHGLEAGGGADGVGRATTQTVVTTSITILISDFFLTKLFMQLL